MDVPIFSYTSFVDFHPFSHTFAWNLPAFCTFRAESHIPIEVLHEVCQQPILRMKPGAADAERRTGTWLGKDGKIGVKRCEIWFLPFLTVSYCFLQVQRTRTVRGVRVKVMS